MKNSIITVYARKRARDVAQNFDSIVGDEDIAIPIEINLSFVSVVEQIFGEEFIQIFRALFSLFHFCSNRKASLSWFLPLQLNSPTLRTELSSDSVHFEPLDSEKLNKCIARDLIRIPRQCRFKRAKETHDPHVQTVSIASAKAQRNSGQRNAGGPQTKRSASSQAKRAAQAEKYLPWFNWLWMHLLQIVWQMCYLIAMSQEAGMCSHNRF